MPKNSGLRFIFSCQPLHKKKMKRNISIRVAVIVAVCVTTLGGIFLGFKAITQPEFKGRVDFEFKHKESQLKMGIERE
jgi:multisubunit Na+/H+ antiporter MnhB subunit